MGKRQLGELQPFELVITLMISELAALPISDPKIPMIYGVIPIVTLIVLQVLISVIELKSEKSRLLFCGRPSILIKNGRIDVSEMKKQKLNLDDLMEEIRLSGFFNIEDIEFALLETCGQLSIIPKTELQPATKKDLNIKSKQDGLPLTIIADGVLRKRNLKLINKDINWLNNELKKNNIKSVKDVFICVFNSQGTLYFQCKRESSKLINLFKTLLKYLHIKKE